MWQTITEVTLQFPLFAGPWSWQGTVEHKRQGQDFQKPCALNYDILLIGVYTQYPLGHDAAGKNPKIFLYQNNHGIFYHKTSRHYHNFSARIIQPAIAWRAELLLRTGFILI
jgi:hypothetical protein